MSFPFNSKPTELIPHAIIEDVNADLWRVCWEPDAAGIVTSEPRLVPKHLLSTRYPHIVEAWNTKHHEEREEAHRIEQNAIAFARQLNAPDPEAVSSPRAEPGVACQQSLLPGMKQHWGDIRKCENHPPDLPGIVVCKGCRVSHHMLDSQRFDRPLIMARGARVPVCGECAARALGEHGVGYRGCVCDSQWHCFRCREEELGKLAKARRDHYREGKCGQCAEERDLVQHVDFCLYCREVRVYAASS